MHSLDFSYGKEEEVIRNRPLLNLSNWLAEDLLTTRVAGADAKRGVPVRRKCGESSVFVVTMNRILVAEVDQADPDNYFHESIRSVAHHNSGMKSRAGNVNTPMEFSFKAWEKRRRNLAPEADQVLPMIAASGRVGMTRMQIGHAVDLDRDVLNQLLRGMIGMGLLTVAWEDSVPVYRTTDVQ